MSKKNEIRASPRSYHFNAEIYVDTDSYDYEEVLARLGSCFDKYAYALHDLDTKDTGELKKAHYHIYGHSTNNTTCAAIAKRMGIPANFVETCDSSTWRGFIRYLIHADHPEKFQYDTSIVQGNFDFMKILDPATESKRVRQIIDEIANGTTDTLTLALFALQNDSWSEFRRGYTIFKDIIKEHNFTVKVKELTE